MDINNSLSKGYTRSEEIANTLSHVVGVIMGFVVCSFFIIYACQSGKPLSIFSLCLYFFGVLSSYIASTVYHACPVRKGKTKLLLRKLDHSAICWHIAGSYSPITLIALYEYGATCWAIVIFTLVWLSAIITTILTFRKIKSHSHIRTVCYVIMGLSILIAINTFCDSVGLKVVMLLVLEGFSYIVGAVLYGFKKVKYIHTVFHVFVLLGDAFHMLAVWNILKIYL